MGLVFFVFFLHKCDRTAPFISLLKSYSEEWILQTLTGTDRQKANETLVSP